VRMTDKREDDGQRKEVGQREEDGQREESGHREDEDNGHHWSAQGQEGSRE
jgi:hypothetical protein